MLKVGSSSLNDPDLFLKITIVNARMLSQGGGLDRGRKDAQSKKCDSCAFKWSSHSSRLTESLGLMSFRKETLLLARVVAISH